ncbi:hypothetical protein P3T21_004994 [Paraburkholderia sp. GAS334]
MNYDSSNSRNRRPGDRHGERSPSEEGSRVVSRTRETTRNWAWAHSNESYDWMDSHSPFTAQDPFH